MFYMYNLRQPGSIINFFYFLFSVGGARNEYPLTPYWQAYLVAAYERAIELETSKTGLSSVLGMQATD
jgi:hypothetical protein